MERKKERCEHMKSLKDKDWKERKKDVRTGKDWKIMIGKKERCEDRKRLKDNDWKERKKDARTWKDWMIMIGKKERKMWGQEKTER